MRVYNERKMQYMTVIHAGTHPCGFIPSRANLWERLRALSEIKVKTEAECSEECVKSREFWEWSAVENRIKHPLLGFDPSTQTTLQARIMMAARTNSTQP